MRGLYFHQNIELKSDLAIPQPTQEESLVRVLLAGVCNTDKEVLKGYKSGFQGILGHEFVGVVEQSSNPDLLGKRVVGELNAGCGECLYCTTGREKHCVNRRVIGMSHKDGCFAEYLSIDTRLLHLVPDGISDEQAVLCEPLAAALEVLDSSHIPPSARVAVIGDGRLAFFLAQVIALGGSEVNVFGHHAEKLEKFSAFANTFLEPTGSYEIVVEATGSPSGLKTALNMVRSEGLFLLKSTYAQMPQVDMSQLVVREITLRGSRCGPFAPALRLLERHCLRLPEIELYPLEEYEKAFSSSAFKAGFDLRS